MTLLVPQTSTAPPADDHFFLEADAARAAGIDDVVDRDALNRGDPHRALTAMPACGATVYRGWIRRVDQNAAFADALAACDMILRTAEDQYRRRSSSSILGVRSHDYAISCWRDDAFVEPSFMPSSAG